ncbi:hypothetical protein WKT22_01998 [Candidatus Lokiarchaeum ossiferum]
MTRGLGRPKVFKGIAKEEEKEVLALKREIRSFNTEALIEGLQ